MAAVLFIVSDDASPATFDLAVEDLLDGTDAESYRSDTVTFADDNDAEPSYASYDLVIISESVTSANVATNYSSLDTEAIPVICMEPGNVDELGMASAGADALSGDVTCIGAGSHIADGNANATDVTLMSAGNQAGNPPSELGSGVQSIWEDADDTEPERVVIYAYEPGATMDTGTAPDRRVFFGMLSNATLTAKGKSILLRCIEWALGETTYNDVILNDGPTVYYRFAETSGSIAADDISGYDLELLGDYDLNVQGVNQYMPDGIESNSTGVEAEYDDDVGNIRSAVTDQVTMEAWIQPNSSHLNSDDGGQIIGYHEAVGGTSNHGWRFRIEDDGVGQPGTDNIRMLSRSSDGTYWHPQFDHTDFAYDGTWYHVVLTLDGSTTNDWSAILYIDGTQVDSASNTSIASGFASSTGQDLLVGWSTYGNGEHFDGILTEVAVYNHILDAETVKLHYDVGSSGPAFSTGSTLLAFITSI